MKVAQMQFTKPIPTDEEMEEYSLNSKLRKERIEQRFDNEGNEESKTVEKLFL